MVGGALGKMCGFLTNTIRIRPSVAYPTVFHSPLVSGFEVLWHVLRKPVRSEGVARPETERPAQCCRFFAGKTIWKVSKYS